jgi:hypothetical protein
MKNYKDLKISIRTIEKRFLFTDPSRSHLAMTKRSGDCPAYYVDDENVRIPGIYKKIFSAEIYLNILNGIDAVFSQYGTFEVYRCRDSFIIRRIGEFQKLVGYSTENGYGDIRQWSIEDFHNELDFIDEYENDFKRGFVISGSEVKTICNKK